MGAQEFIDYSKAHNLVLTTNNDRVDGLDYTSLKQCQKVLCDIIEKKITAHNTDGQH